MQQPVVKAAALNKTESEEQTKKYNYKLPHFLITIKKPILNKERDIQIDIISLKK